MKINLTKNELHSIMASLGMTILGSADDFMKAQMIHTLKKILKILKRSDEFELFENLYMEKG